MKISTLVLCCMLSACAVMETPKFPTAPEVLMEKCPPLKTMKDGETSLQILLDTVAENYKLYYHCSKKQEGWAEWYKQEKKVYNGLGK